MKKISLNQVGLVLILFLFWIGISGSLKWPQLLTGLLVAAFVAHFNRKLLLAPAERPPVSIRTALLSLALFGGFLLDIFKANFKVAYVVLHPRLPIEPGLVEYQTDLQKELTRVLLANATTLTPGTLTVLADGDRFLIHTMVVEGAESLKNWDLAAGLKKLEEG